MNESGGPVSALLRFFSVPVERLVVVHDELDIDAGARPAQARWRRGRPQRPALDQRLARHQGLPPGARRHRPPARAGWTPPTSCCATSRPAERKELPFVLDEAADAVEALVDARACSTRSSGSTPRAEPAGPLSGDEDCRSARLGCERCPRCPPCAPESPPSPAPRASREALAVPVGGGRRRRTCRAPGPSSSPRWPRPAPARRCSPSPPPGARPRTSTPRSRRAWAPGASACSPPGRRCRTSGSARAATPSASACRCCAGWPTPSDGDATHGPLSVVVAPVRAVLQPIVHGPGRPAPGRAPGRRRGRRSSRSSRPSRPPPTPAPTSSSGAASSPCAAASSTSSRPPRSTRCGWSSGATRSRRSAGSRSPTSARLEVAEHGLWAPPCRELLLTDAVRERAARARRPSCPGAADLLEKLAEGIAVEGMESLAPALVDGMEPLLDLLPDGRPARRAATPSASAPAPTTSSRPARSSSRPAGPTPRAATPCRSTSRPCSAPPRSAPSPSCAARPASSACRWLDLTPFAGDDDDERRRRSTSASRSSPDLPRQHRRTPVAELRRLVADDWSVLVATEGPGLAKRVAEVLAEHDVAEPARHRPAPTPRPGRRHGHHRRASAPASSRPARGSRSSPRPTSPARPAARARRPRTCAGCRPGAATRSTRSSCAPATSSCTSSTASAGSSRWCSAPSAARTREYLVIEYAAEQARPARRPALRADRPARPGHPLRRRRAAHACNKLGGSDWHKTKSRARKRYVKQIAAELIRLYSARMATHRARLRARTPRGSASSRTPSPTSRRPTS